MATIIIECDDELARHVEEAARREHKSISDWIKAQVQPEADRLSRLEAMEQRAVANGYPPGWMKLYGTLADDEGFVAPTRSGTRPIASMDEE